MMGAGVIRVGLSWSRTPRTPRAGSARIPNPAPTVDRGPNSRYSYSGASPIRTRPIRYSGATKSLIKRTLAMLGLAAR